MVLFPLGLMTNGPHRSPLCSGVKPALKTPVFVEEHFGHTTRPNPLHVVHVHRSNTFPLTLSFPVPAHTLQSIAPLPEQTAQEDERVFFPVPVESLLLFKSGRFRGPFFLPKRYKL